MEGRMYPAIRFFSAEDPAITATRIRRTRLANEY
jgi:hypothetical protein